MNKLIITRWKNMVLTALSSDGKISQLQVEPWEHSSVLNNIYIGKVKNILNNINSAFVEIGEGHMGYYSLTENKCHLYTKPHDGDKLRAGDEIIVQVMKDAVKTKAPVLSSNLCFTGKYCVLTSGKSRIGFSNKIHDSQWKNYWKEKLEAIKDDGHGLILRTNAKDAEENKILLEAANLSSLYTRIMSDAVYRTCYSLLWKSPASYVASIRDSHAESLEKIVTDDEIVYENIKQYLETSQKEDIHKLSFYQDSLLPLHKLYSLEAAMEGALQKKVWLKSGGYLVIEQTEALVVVDVNTGKYTGKKNMCDTILKINMEAADEIAYQLCLRNLSGIIIIDFIDMERPGDRELLMKQLESAVSKDPVKTTVVGISKLNLVEVTRKKIRKPLYEQVQGDKGDI